MILLCGMYVYGMIFGQEMFRLAFFFLSTCHHPFVVEAVIVLGMQVYPLGPT